MSRRLTADAQAERDDFERHVREFGGCACFISSPCGSCTHPGNPHNQEDDSCWEPKLTAVTSSRNQREGKLFGIYRGRVRRIGPVNFDFSNFLPFEVTEDDFRATRKERRQHKLNRSFIRRQALELCK